MDLLPSPTGKSILGHTPFVGGDLRWDGGPFLHFACRRDWLENVPLHMRQCGCPSAFRDRQHLKPLEPGDRRSFLQTWLFFGLLAEFYGLNDEPPALSDEPALRAHGEAIPPDPRREARIQALYADFTKPLPNVDGDDQGAGEYVSAAMLVDPAEHEKIAQHLLMKKGAGDSDNVSLVNYLSYLHDCLVFTNGIAGRLEYNTTNSHPSISASIAALGEFFASLLPVLSQTLGIPCMVAGVWGPNYLSTGGHVKEEMLRQGWCRSDVERLHQSFYGLATRHFLSHMKMPACYSHDMCSVKLCNAAQVNAETYVLTHDEGCGGCEILSVDQGEVKRILNLENSNGYPVLRLETGSGSDGKVVNIHVEQYDENKPYVALSHVWADGLGNPTANGLQSCQIDRLAQLILKIPYPSAAHKAGGAVEGGEPSQYWFWIDTLCCPIDIKEKLIALERIGAVYRNATHVLVLDKSVSPFTSQGKGRARAAENCLRMVGSATWMRRLWTLQEGALAKSLYFQFKDRAVDFAQEAARLKRLGSRDLRYKPIYENVALMMFQLQGLCLPTFAPPPPGAPGLPTQGQRHLLDQIQIVQKLLYFRNVSVASDEPLCIATLLSIDPRIMTTAKRCRQERMAKLWGLVTKKSGGFFAARVIFYNNQPLGLAALHGWRWAPKSLLSQVDDGFSYDIATTRLHFTDSPDGRGTVTEHGLRVALPGMSIALRPWAAHASGQLWPWSLFTRLLVMNEMMARHRSTGQWFRLSSMLHDEQTGRLTRDECAKRDDELLEQDKTRPWEGQRPSQPIFNELCWGELALIRDMEHPAPLTVNLLARLQTTSTYTDDTTSRPLQVHACLTICVAELADALWPGFDMLCDMARRVCGSEINQELLDFLARQEGGRDPDPKCQEYQKITKGVCEEMKRVAKEALVEDEQGYLARVAVEFGCEGEEAVWKMLVFLLPFDVSVENLPDDQVWIVDGPVVGDGLCHDDCCS